MSADAGADIDQSFIAEALPAFVSEAREQLGAMEQLLLELEQDPGNRELLDALFRCAHTVKGSAGIFGLHKIVAFTHHVETLLDQVREGAITLAPALGTLLLRCNDQILHLVDTASGPDADTSAHAEARADLVTELHAVMGDPQTTPASPAGATTTAATAGAGASASARWLISARFGTECFRNGMDPLSIVRYLGTLGSIVAISCDQSAIPLLQVLDPESCNLSVELTLETTATRQTIEGAFSFVKDDCELRLVEPAAPLEHYARLLDAMPDRPLLGEILVKIGAITQAQLDAGLRTQHGTHPAPGAPSLRLGDVLQQQTGLAPEVVAAALQKQNKASAAPAPDDSRRRHQPARRAGDRRRRRGAAGAPDAPGRAGRGQPADDAADRGNS